jgi:Xaa-Pro aminopeptidase
MSPERPSDEHLARLDRLLATEGLEAVWFGRSNNFAWVTGGDNTVDRATEPGSAAVGYDGTDLTVVTTNIEGERLAAEQLADEVTVETYPWHETTLADAVADASATPAAADFPVPGFETVDAARVRQPLTDADVEAYRSLGATVGSAVAAVCRNLSQTTTEREAAARLRGRLAEHGVDTPVVLVGGDRRAQAYRHPVPTDERVGDYAIVSVTARRAGLYASCTRTVAFEPPAWLQNHHEAAARVEVSALAATQRVGIDGGTAGDVFDAIQEAYAAVGHDGEWKHHHQGGAAGYAGREWIAEPGHDADVRLPMAYAWNPTVSGAKSEDTIHVTTSGFETLTTSDDWPTRAASAVDDSTTVARPAILVQ